MTDEDSIPRANGTVEWPVRLRGVTESVVATLGPNDLWNLAALGLHAPEEDGRDAGDPVRARTWGHTRTRRNFEARGEGVVQFVTDPREFVDAAVTVREEPEPVLDSAEAWARVTVERVGSGTEGDTEWLDWHLAPVETVSREPEPTTIDRGFAAVIEATVVASRLDVSGYDTGELLDRLAYFADVVDRCGGPRERAAFETLSTATEWRKRR
ncbi:DUF447 domain-containing protein [Halorarum halobium]|uniref:DUF447 domain-containing protein n=1 Tax=Halorarum halobium TaxID=3075121 RepID=UPI0028ADA7E5|nr:DUF447 domain-containing protein [Halobaculum sp. XH14]